MPHIDYYQYFFMSLMDPVGIRPNIKRPNGRLSPNSRERDKQSQTPNRPEVTPKGTKSSSNKNRRLPELDLRADKAKP